MSTRKDSFILLGWRLPYAALNEHYDLIEPYFPKGGYGKSFAFHDDFTIIYDGMCGKWAMLGAVLHVANAEGNFEGKDGVLQVSPPSILDYAPMMYSAEEFVRINKLDVILTAPPRLFLVEHWH